MNRNHLLTRCQYPAELRPLLVGFKLTATERQDLVALRSQLIELDGQLAQCSSPAVRAGLKSARCGIRSGPGSADDLQATL